MTSPNPTPKQVMDALLNGNNDLFVVDNIISSAKAIIHFVSTSDLDADWKYSLHELEQRFLLYARIWESTTTPPPSAG
ncbi:MAG: hypothetical protein NTW29_15085 [Bacteroidetes bacterium]|nr:hypothetical protein [Bacteroidota bacterium]